MAITVSRTAVFHLLNDLHTMNTLLHERFPDTPIILYGHSMGSFYALVRRKVAGEHHGTGYFRHSRPQLYERHRPKTSGG